MNGFIIFAAAFAAGLIVGILIVHLTTRKTQSRKSERTPRQAPRETPAQRSTREAAVKQNSTPQQASSQVLFELPVVGESKYQDVLDKVAEGKIPEGHDFKVEAVCVPQNDNPYNDQAVAVTIGGEIVGHLDRNAATAYRNKWGEEPQSCRARIKGGWDRGGGDEGSYGVTVYLRG